MTTGLNVKVEIISVDDTNRSAVVWVYTDALYQKFAQDFWPARVENLIASGRFKPGEEAQALEQAKIELRPGWFGNIQIQRDPMPSGRELINYLVSHSVGYGTGLAFTEKCLIETADMSHIEQLKGQVFECNTEDAMRSTYPASSIPIHRLP